MRDIENRSDIEFVLNRFYTGVFSDELIGHFFTEVVPLKLETHVPVIADFWEGMIFNTHGYRKNVMEIHAGIHKIEAIKKIHLERWVQLFTKTLDENFAGKNTTLMKQRAASIATLMDIKLNHAQIKKL
jgi:hemoglobin